MPRPAVSAGCVRDRGRRWENVPAPDPVTVALASAKVIRNGQRQKYRLDGGVEPDARLACGHKGAAGSVPASDHTQMVTEYCGRGDLGSRTGRVDPDERR